MTTVKPQLYTSKIIKAGALIADTRTLLTHWNETETVSSNISRFRHENIFGKTSRSRVEDILRIFRQRYLADPSVTLALVTLAKCQVSSVVLDRIFYFLAVKSDLLLHDVVTEIIWDIFSQGRNDITVENVRATISRWVDEGKTAGQWGIETRIRVSRNIMATLRDFGILQGKVNKSLAPIYLPIEAFSFIAFYLKQASSSEALLHHPDWHLYLLSDRAIERLFMEAHQHRFLDYYAAGSTVRITFSANTIEEYARVIVQRTT